jgi:hypothetical protein
MRSSARARADCLVLMMSTIRFRETTLTVAERPPGVARPGRYWWVEFDGAWFRVARRSAKQPPMAVIQAWLHANVVHPDDDPENDERGPAWTTSARSPLVFIDRGTTFKVWADSHLRSSPASPDGLIHWIVRRANRRPFAIPLDCDDTILEVLRAVRAA